MAEGRRDEGQFEDEADDGGAVRSARQVFLRTALGAAAGAAAATAAGVIGAGPAGAANGDPVNVGQTNSGNGGTAVYAWADSSNSLYGVWGKSNGSTAILGESTGGGNARGVEGQARSAGIGVWGETVEGVGVYGTSPNGSGVYGTTDAAQNGVGVWGRATGANSTGVRGSSFTGPAVSAYSVSGPTLHLSSNNLSFPTNAGSWNEGDIVFGANNALWLCILASVGQASKWIRLSRVFQPLDTPVRIYDSRAGLAPLGVTKGKTAAGQERIIDATLGGAAPAGIASAVQVNLTVVNIDAWGWLAPVQERQRRSWHVDHELGRDQHRRGQRHHRGRRRRSQVQGLGLGQHRLRHRRNRLLHVIRDFRCCRQPRVRRSSRLRVTRSTTGSPRSSPHAQSVQPTVTTVPPGSCTPITA